MVETCRNDNLSEWYTAEQAYKTCMGEPSEDNAEVDAAVEDTLRQVRACALVRMDQTVFDFVDDSPLFPKVADELQERGFVIYDGFYGIDTDLRSYIIYWGKPDYDKIPYDLENIADVVVRACGVPQKLFDKILGLPKVSKVTVEVPQAYTKDDPDGISSNLILMVEHIARKHGYREPQVRFKKIHDAVYELEITDTIS